MDFEYDWRCCTLCQRTYSCDVIILAGQESSGKDSQQKDNNRVIPVKSAVCYHTLCLSCVEQQTQVLSKNNGYLENLHPTVICPVCRKADAFSAEEPTISLLTCKLLKKEAQDVTVIPQLSHEPDDTKRGPSIDKTTNKNNKFSVEKEEDLESLEQGDSKLNNKLKYKPDIYVFNEEPSHPTKLHHHSLSPDNMSRSEDESVSNLESGEESYDLEPVNEGCVTQTPGPLSVRPSTLPGVVWVDGPNFNSAIGNDEEGSISNDFPEPYLAVGTLVIDPPIVHAKPWVPFYVKYWRWLFGILVVGVIVIAVVLAVEVPKKKRAAVRTTSLKNIVLQVSGQSSVNDLGFSQKKALDWILGKNNIIFDPLKKRNQIIQRYQLATLYYSTSGENWTNSGNFLSADDECNWFQESVLCSEDRVTNITLGKQIFFIDEDKK
jgi:hypothetical protein